MRTSDALFALGLVGALLLAGCGSGPVRAPAPQPDTRAARACAALSGQLPGELSGQPRRPTEPASELVAAWGSPPIVLRCGVAEPTALRPASRLTVVNGVEWFPEPDRSPVRFTTVDRAARVELRWPARHGVPAAALVALAGPIKQAIPKGPGGAAGQ